METWLVCATFYETLLHDIHVDDCNKLAMMAGVEKVANFGKCIASDRWL